eukprot:COSAG02_NODE_20869_length_812_cov_5.416550_1_plen_34_part_10
MGGARCHLQAHRDGLGMSGRTCIVGAGWMGRLRL